MAGKDGVVELESTRWPFSFEGDGKGSNSTRSIVPYLPFIEILKAGLGLHEDARPFNTEAVAAQLRAAFEADLPHAKQRQFAEWKDRGAWHKFIDGLAYLGRSQL